MGRPLKMPNWRRKCLKVPSIFDQSVRLPVTAGRRLQRRPRCRDLNNSVWEQTACNRQTIDWLSNPGRPCSVKVYQPTYGTLIVNYSIG